MTATLRAPVTLDGTLRCKQGQKVDELKQRNGLMSSSTGLMYLLLSIFGLGIVSMALLQNEVNAVAEGRYNA